MLKRVLSFVLVVAMVMGIFAVIPVQASAASELKVSDALLNYVKRFEGFHAIPYWDHAQWTVGFGSHCPSDKLEQYKKEGIPMADAEVLLASSLNGYGEKVKEFAKKEGITLTQAKFDALVSFTYNLGTGWMSQKDGTMRNAVVKGYTGNEFLAAISVYCNAGGSYMAGLMVRRLTEANMYLNGVYGRYAPGNYANVRYDGNGGTVTASAQGYDCNLYAVPASTATRSGYAFQGWYTAAEGGVRVTELDAGTDGMILYAHWAADSEGGTILPDGGVKVTVTGSRVNIRKGPGLSYAVSGSVVKGTELTITKVKEANGYLWGKCEKGWLALSYTTYEEKNQGSGDTGGNTPTTPADPGNNMPNLPTEASVISADGVTIRNGPHATYPKIGTLAKGQVITIVEIVDVLGTQWGRFEGGWVSVDGGGLQFENYPTLAHSVVVTIKYSAVNVRCGPGLSYTKVGTVYKNAKLTVTSLVKVDGQIWGKHSQGWSRLDSTYSDLDESKIAQYENHSFGRWYESQAATCAVKGQERRDCSLCDHFEVKETVFADHNYGRWTATEPGTCVTPGKEARVCTVCGDTQTRTGSLGAHACGEWVDVVPATCVSEGQQRRDCAYCDYFETQKTSLGDHVYGEWVEAETGIERRDCSLCDHFETRETVPGEHVYGDWEVVKLPSCTEKGEARRQCTHCDLFETREIAQTDHNYGRWVQTKEPTCKEAGEESAKCSSCGHVETRAVAMLAHTVTTWRTVTEPTCADEGVEEGRCSICGEKVTRPIASTDHVFGEWIVYRESSCAVAGESRRTCKTCEKYESRELALADHAYGQWTQTKAPTTTEEGQERRDCENCDHYETRAIPCVDENSKLFATVICKVLRIRKGPGITYDSVGILTEYQRVEILEQRRDAKGDLWGRYTRGWIHLGSEYVRLETRGNSPAQRVFATVTTYNGLNIRNGPGTSFAVVGALREGARVEIFEQRVIYGQTWGCTDQGWICLTGYTSLETVTERAASFTVAQEQTTVKTYATVTCSALMIREGAGTEYDLVGKLRAGDRVEILEQLVLNNAVWGKTESGWIHLTNYTRLETETEEN